MEALVGARLHTSEGLVPGRALLLADGTIRDIVAEDAVPATARTTRLAGGTLAAGFIDLQVNGGGGVMFNDAPTAATIAAIGRAHRAFGTTGFLATFISGARADMARAVAAVREAMDSGEPGVLGIHFEGPHINPARRGAHDARAIRPPTEGDIDLLASLATGRTLVTLAPECVTPADIAALAARGVIVAAGHSEANADTMDTAMAHGLTGVTHLFNAMGPLGHREPGAAGAALTRDRLACGIIADGAHVHWDVLRPRLARETPWNAFSGHRRDGTGGSASRRAGYGWALSRRRASAHGERLPALGRRPARRLAAEHGAGGEKLRHARRHPARRRARHGLRLSGGFPWHQREPGAARAGAPRRSGLARR